MRTTFSEKIKSKALTIKEWAKSDFEDALCFTDSPEYYNRYKEPHSNEHTDFLYEYAELKEIKDERVPDWVYNESYTEEEKKEIDNLMDDFAFDMCQEYEDEWDSLVEDFYEDKERRAVEQFGTDELKEKYEKAKAAYETARDNYYGYCMNGGGGRKAFREMYGDGNHCSYGEWLIRKCGEPE